VSILLHYLAQISNFMRYNSICGFICILNIIDTGVFISNFSLHISEIFFYKTTETYIFKTCIVHQLKHILFFTYLRETLIFRPVFEGYWNIIFLRNPYFCIRYIPRIRRKDRRTEGQWKMMYLKSDYSNSPVALATDE
jgi:hypothetical protein